MEFKDFAKIVNAKFLELAKSGRLLKVNVPKDVLWDTYQDAYGPKHNPIFRERRVHECNTCYNFIKKLGNVVGIVDGKKDSIWNVKGLKAPYKDVAKKMHELVMTGAISSVFLTDEKLAGKEYNIEENEAGNIRWEHFYADIDQAYISQSVAADCGSIESTVSVFARALKEFSIETLDSVIDLCDSIYKGEEFKPTVVKFKKAKEAYEASKDKTVFVWTEYKNYPAKIRNTAIGTLIVNINEGMELENAVEAYEKVVAPDNYKRTTAVVTEGMKKEAVKEIDALGYRPSLPRRHAKLTDISVANVLYASSTAYDVMKDALDDILDSVVTKKVGRPKKAVDISIEDFLATVLPNSTKVEALVENVHLANFMTLVAPVNPDAPNMLKWDNNFSWSYKGEVTDSMKERVKTAGGAVDGEVRFSIQWNEDGQDGSNDLDAHTKAPNTHIFYRHRNDECGGELDIDITNPSRQTKDGIAVENTTWPSIAKMVNGDYKFYVHNFGGYNISGFRAQVEILGTVYEYDYPTGVGKDVVVATVTIKDGKATIKHSLSPSTAARQEWEISTLEYQPVSTIMLSPNFWDDNAVGNKHYFFTLEGCKNPSPVRGFYNEFLNEGLRPHKKMFEVLSSKMKCEPSDEQLSGLGFSSTQRNELSVKVDGVPYNIKF